MDSVLSGNQLCRFNTAFRSLGKASTEMNQFVRNCKSMLKRRLRSHNNRKCKLSPPNLGPMTVDLDEYFKRRTE